MDTIIEENVDFWYDCLEDCYANDMPFKLISDYLEAITDEDTEWLTLNRSMTSTSFATALPVGCIISQIINGLLSIKKCFNVNESFQRSSLDQLEDDGLPQKLEEYTVTLSSGEEMYILAANAMDAAYSALELSTDRHTDLINVRITDEW